MPPIKDLTGYRYGDLIVTAQAPGRTPYGGALWLCLCRCGTKKTVASTYLRCGAVRSCGCLHNPHGEVGYVSTEYNSWRGMKSRCSNPNIPEYKYYGGRGITYCDRWIEFGPFLEDMGMKPSPGWSIERVDNSEGYYPENCIWASPITQSNNQRRRSGT